MSLQVVGFERRPLIQPHSVRQAVARGVALAAAAVGLSCGLVAAAVALGTATGTTTGELVLACVNAGALGVVALPLAFVERWAERDGHRPWRIYLTAWAVATAMLLGVTLSTSYVNSLYSGGSFRDALSAVGSLAAGPGLLGQLAGLAVMATTFAGIIASRVRGSGLLAQTARASWIPILLMAGLTAIPLLLLQGRLAAFGGELMLAMLIPLAVMSALQLGFAFTVALSWRIGDALAERCREPQRA